MSIPAFPLGLGALAVFLLVLGHLHAEEQQLMESCRYQQYAPAECFLRIKGR
jgi:hypothetical protein